MTMDNIECIVGDTPWEMAIFNLYNRIQKTESRLLLKRLERDMRTLSATLDQLDHESIRAQRKLTIQFVKAILNL